MSQGTCTVFGPLLLPRVHFISRRCCRQCQSLTLIHHFREQTPDPTAPPQGRAGWPRFLSRLLSLPCVQGHGLSQSAKCKHSMRAWPCVLGDARTYLTRGPLWVETWRVESGALQLTPSHAICLSSVSFPSIETGKASSPLFFLLFFLTTLPLFKHRDLGYQTRFLPCLKGYEP